MPTINISQHYSLKRVTQIIPRLLNPRPDPVVPQELRRGQELHPTLLACSPHIDKDHREGWNRVQRKMTREFGSPLNHPSCIVRKNRYSSGNLRQTVSQDI